MFDLTVQVLNLSPRVTAEDLHIFFSYCGSITDMKLQRMDDNSQSALVTFKEPYARDAALLLDEAVIVDRRVRISPLQTPLNLSRYPLNSPNTNNGKKGNEIFTLATQSMVRTMASKSVEALRKAKEYDERYKLLERSRMLREKTISTFHATEKPAGQAESEQTVAVTPIIDQALSIGALWMSSIFDKASKVAAEYGNSRRNNINSRKQK